MLLVRVEDRSGLSHFTVARSHDGFTEWKLDARPALERRASRYEERCGIEDSRITKIGDEYLIAYTGGIARGAIGVPRLYQRLHLLPKKSDRVNARRQGRGPLSLRPLKADTHYFIGRFLPMPAGGNVHLYCGAADTCVAVASARIDDLVGFAYSHCI